MTILTQLQVIRLLPLGMLLILPATSGAQQRPPIFEKLAKTYGLRAFGQIEAIRYTFNAEAPGRNVSRSWTWEFKLAPPACPRASGDQEEEGHQHQLALPCEQQRRTGWIPGFLNDNYWLLLHFIFPGIPTLRSKMPECRNCRRGMVPPRRLS